MWIFYALSLVPIVIGAILWIISPKKIHPAEWVIGAVFAFAMAGSFHAFSYASATQDTQTLSATVESVVFYPKWVEEYTDIETYTTGSGKDQQTHTRTVTRYRTHHEYWTCIIPHFDIEDSISEDRYNDFNRKLGGRVETKSKYKSGFYSGDKNIYVTGNTSRETIPYMISSGFQNKVKASPSLFKYSVPEDTSHLFEYPYNKNNFQSERLLGNARNNLSLLQWDQLNGRLGKNKKVNVIVVGFPSDAPIQHSIDLESYWIGGKRNDLVITYAGDNSGIKWSRVFGWTEEELVKRNIESILLKDGLVDLAPKVEQEIINHYVIKDWSKFDYLSVEPSKAWIISFVIIQIIAQIALWIFFHFNDIDIDSYKPRYAQRGRFR